MKRILALSFFPAFVPPSNGGESRLFNFYKSLSRFHHVTLLSSSHLNAQEEVILHGSNFVERRIPKDSQFTAKWQELNKFSSGGDLSAVCIAASGGFSTLLHKAYLEEYDDADIIIHDSPFTIDYDLFFSVDNKVRIYNSYNCETTLYKSLHPEPKSQPLWDCVQNAETRLLAGCDAVLYCNKKDLEEFKDLAPNAEFTAIAAPNGMSPVLGAVRNPDSNAIRSVVFIGSGHPPNVEAALQITDNIAPALPHIRFHIIGNCLPKGKYPQNIVRHGFVDDKAKAELICKADLAINPMGAGSGSNVKVFDLFSYGVPVLSSEFGMRGIDATHGQNCLISPVSDFPKAIESWSTRYEELQTIGISGQEFAEENYSWDVIIRNVADKLSDITKTNTWSKRFILVLNDYDSFQNTGGGGVRTRGIYAAVNDWCPVVFVCFSKDEQLSFRYENDDTIVFNVPKTGDHIEEQQVINASFHVSAEDIIAHRHCGSNALLVTIYNILKGLCRNIVVEHPYMTSLPISFRDRFVYSSQNNETQIKTGLLKYHPLYETLVQHVEQIEREAVEYSSAVIAVSQTDAESFTKGVRTAGPIIVARNGASGPAIPTKQDLETATNSINADRAAVFVGSAHMPNIDAVKFIIETLAPACPTVEFHIVGSVCNAFALNSASNIRFWGTLSETMKSAVMQSCSIAINTVVSGGGSNIKLADYFANGLYVVTTPFGLRGYDEVILDHLMVAELSHFSKTLVKAFQKADSSQTSAPSKRKQLFIDHLSMKATAQDVVSLLKNLEQPKKKVLFVTYRYTDPAPGGAESMVGNLIEALDNTNAFQVDVVSPEISKMTNRNRFAENYEFDKVTGAKVGLKNVRFARFPIDNERYISNELADAWNAQALVEKEIYLELKNQIETSGLAWGWGDPERQPDAATKRWAYTSCGLHLQRKATVRFKCYSSSPVVIWVRNQKAQLIQTQTANAHFTLEFTAPPGTIEITASNAAKSAGDARPLAFLVSELRFDDEVYDLGKALLPISTLISDQERFRVLNGACSKIREPLDINLTRIRGPFSPELERYLEVNIQEYDLVITHNNIFRPAVIAVKNANKQKVPVISIPHAHLDDDFYHFPDVQRSVINSDLVLAAPKIACEFYADKGANVAYLPAGIDINEAFTNDDIKAFKEVCPVEQPFILVLGRKSRAKRYQMVIDAVEQLAKDNSIHLVMIGPDDDNLAVSSSCVSYLGPQPRDVVRGALLSCKCLANMSSSESFGIVLLEAWMAGKPVIVNKACAAFHDLATDNQNALMVDDIQSLREAIIQLISDPVFCDRLAENGRQVLSKYDWSSVGSEFINFCNELIENSSQ